MQHLAVVNQAICLDRHAAFRRIISGGEGSLRSLWSWPQQYDLKHSCCLWAHFIPSCLDKADWAHGCPKTMWMSKSAHKCSEPDAPESQASFHIICEFSKCVCQHTALSTRHFVGINQPFKLAHHMRSARTCQKHHCLQNWRS